MLYVSEKMKSCQALLIGIYQSMVYSAFGDSLFQGNNFTCDLRMEAFRHFPPGSRFLVHGLIGLRGEFGRDGHDT